VTSLAQLLEALAGGLPQPAGSAASGVVVSATDVELTLPIESRIERRGTLHATLPRGRMATGFDMPLGRLAARFAAASPEEGAA
jgi:hypothetical protein